MLIFSNKNEKRKSKVKIQNEIRRLKILLNHYKCSDDEKTYIRGLIRKNEEDLRYMR